MENIMEHIGDDGSFTDSFHEEAAKSPDFKNADGTYSTKAFINAKNLRTLFKNHVNLEGRIGELRDSIKNDHIPRLRKDASDTERAVHRDILLKELGKPESPDEYKMRPDSWTDEQANVDYENYMKEVAHRLGVPKFLMDELAKENNAFSMAAHQVAQESNDKVFNDGFDKLQTEWAGDTFNTNVRGAIKAILELSLDEGFKSRINPKSDANPDGLGMYETPGDREKWKQLDVSAATLRQWAHIQAKQGPGRIARDEGGGGAAQTDADKDRQKAGRRYTHETSKRLVQLG